MRNATQSGIPAIRAPRHVRGTTAVDVQVSASEAIAYARTSDSLDFEASLEEYLVVHVRPIDREDVGVAINLRLARATGVI